MLPKSKKEGLSQDIVYLLFIIPQFTLLAVSPSPSPHHPLSPFSYKFYYTSMLIALLLAQSQVKKKIRSICPASSVPADLRLSCLCRRLLVAVSLIISLFYWSIDSSQNYQLHTTLIEQLTTSDVASSERPAMATN